MENENVVVKQKSNKGVIAVLIILVLGLCTYIAYDKFVLDKNTKTNEITQTNVKEESKNNNTLISNTDELYKQYINNIKTRKNAENVTFSGVDGEPNGYKHFILGTDNKLYVETYNDSDAKIPGAVGSGGDYTGKYINVDGVVRIFKTYHTPGEGGSQDGLLVLKEDGNLYIIRNIETNNYNLEKIEQKNVVTAYNSISSPGITYVVDIQGNSFEIK